MQHVKCLSRGYSHRCDPSIHGMAWQLSMVCVDVCAPVTCADFLKT